MKASSSLSNVDIEPRGADVTVTGAVGIEGLSRGCREAHFVELDPRVARSVLEPNLEACDMTRAASVHVMVRSSEEIGACPRLSITSAPMQADSSRRLCAVSSDLCAPCFSHLLSCRKSRAGTLCDGCSGQDT